MSIVADLGVLEKLSAEQITELAGAFESADRPGAEKIRGIAGKDLSDSDIDGIVRSFDFVGKTGRADWSGLVRSSLGDEKASAMTAAMGKTRGSGKDEQVPELPHVHEIQMSTEFMHLSGSGMDSKLIPRLVVQAGLHSASGRADALMQMDLDSAKKLAEMLNSQIQALQNRIRPEPGTKNDAGRAAGQDARAARWQGVDHDVVRIKPCKLEVWSPRAAAKADCDDLLKLCGLKRRKGPVPSIRGMLSEYGEIDATALVREIRGRG